MGPRHCYSGELIIYFLFGVYACFTASSPHLLQDIQTNNFFAQALRNGGISIQYLPAIITILGFIMSFATGSVSLDGGFYVLLRI